MEDCLRRHIALIASLCFTFLFLGTRAQRVEARPPMRVALVAAKAPVEQGPRLAALPASVAEERGAYFWPIYVEGPLAAQMRRLPRALQRVLSASAGPTILLPERAVANDIGLCAGAYVRF